MKATIALATILFTASVQAQDWGKFSEPLNVELLNEKNHVRLLMDFTYKGPGPEELFWLAPKDTITDGASIPRIAWSVIGAPFEGQYRKAAIIHDVACVEQTRSWQATHRAFYTAMRAAGVGESQAKIMYAAVYHFGPRWAEPKSILLPRTEAALIVPKLEKLKAELPIGMEAVLASDGRPVSRTISKGLLKREKVEEVIGAVFEVRVVQPPSSEAEFERMKALIQKKDLTLAEIEGLQATETSGTK
ncbi:MULTISPECIES: DUF1353 domain-containing protein [Pseudomonas]|uniref:DUF1353 domain-containing protein n=1 Tax=Pseudomonas TaxID=286 RepID=UPI001FF3A7A6|nr:DUF1353 domain-containing protein [Pseudomonas sp. YL2]